MMPKRLLLVSVFLVALLSACSSMGGLQTSSPIPPTMSPSPDISNYFPLKGGAYWVYQGKVKWTQANSSDVMEQEITWKMEVGRVFKRNAIVGYEMTGAPWDLAWYDPAKEPGKYGILQVGGKFYTVPIETLARLSNEQDDLSNLVNENTIFLDAPLDIGKKFCDPESLARSDNMYCWVVGQAKPFEAGSVKGIDLSPDLLEYPVTKQTMPDSSMTYFVPGVGISRYSYMHHGTVSEVDVHLIEYYPGN